MMETQEMRVVRNENGDIVTVAQLSDEQMEILKVLFESQGWKLYRQLLIQAKNGYFDAALPMKDPNEILKTMGTVAGINLAVNQLGLLMASYKQRQAKAVKEVTKNPSQTQA